MRIDKMLKILNLRTTTIDQIVNQIKFIKQSFVFDKLTYIKLY